MVGWQHQLNGLKFKHTQGDSGGQGSLACCSPWGHRVRAEQQQKGKAVKEPRYYKLRVPFPRRVDQTMNSQLSSPFHFTRVYARAKLRHTGQIFHLMSLKN